MVRVSFKIEEVSLIYNLCRILRDRLRIILTSHPRTSSFPTFAYSTKCLHNKIRNIFFKTDNRLYPRTNKLCIQVGYVLIITLFSFITAHSKETKDIQVNRIKSDKSYIWAEREASGLDEAKRLSDSDLLKKIQVSISVSSEVERRESDSPDEYFVSEEFFSKHRSFSSLYLRGLDHIETREGKHWRILSYIHRDSLAQSFALRKIKIREYVNAGLTEAAAGRMGEALRNYYWGYLLALTYPDTIHLVLDDSGTSYNPQVALMNLLNQTFNRIVVGAEDCYRDGRTVIAPLRFIYGERPVKGLSFIYYSGLGMEYALVEDGRADIPLYDEPVNPTRKLVFSIEYAYLSEMAADREIAELYEIFAENRFTSQKSVNLRFPWIATEPNTREITTSVELVMLAQDYDVESKPTSEALEVLGRCRKTVEFLDVLNQYQKLGILIYGNRADFNDGKGCFVAIVDDVEVNSLLYFDGNRFNAITTGATYADLTKKFSGKRQIWIREVE